MSDELDRGGLRAALTALFFEPHSCPARQPIEVGTHDAVAMEVKGPAVAGRNAPEVFRRVELRHPTYRLGRMVFDLPASPPLMVLQPPPNRAIGVAQSDVHVFMGLPLAVLPIDNDAAPRCGDLKVDFIEMTLVAVPVPGFNDYMAANDLRTEFLQALHQLAYPRFQGWRGLDVAEGDLQRQEHIRALRSEWMEDLEAISLFRI
jgi:hypothetical protein